MCAALTDKNSFDLCATYRAFLTFAIVHSKIILEFAASVDPVEGGAVAADALI